MLIMRQLTDTERALMDAARNELLEGINLDSIKPIIAISAAHRSGFVTGLDHSAERIAALEAENARLREALKPFAEAAVLVFIEPKIRTLPVEAEYLVEARRALREGK